MSSDLKVRGEAGGVPPLFLIKIWATDQKIIELFFCKDCDPPFAAVVTECCQRFGSNAFTIESRKIEKIEGFSTVLSAQNLEVIRLRFAEVECNLTQQFGTYTLSLYQKQSSTNESGKGIVESREKLTSLNSKIEKLQQFLQKNPTQTDFHSYEQAINCYFDCSGELGDNGQFNNLLTSFLNEADSLAGRMENASLFIQNCLSALSSIVIENISSKDELRACSESISNFDKQVFNFQREIISAQTSYEKSLSGLRRELKDSLTKIVGERKKLLGLSHHATTENLITNLQPVFSTLQAMWMRINSFEKTKIAFNKNAELFQALQKEKQHVIIERGQISLNAEKNMFIDNSMRARMELDSEFQRLRDQAESFKGEIFTLATGGVAVDHVFISKIKEILLKITVAIDVDKPKVQQCFNLLRHLIDLIQNQSGLLAKCGSNEYQLLPKRETFLSNEIIITYLTELLKNLNKIFSTVNSQTSQSSSSSSSTSSSSNSLEGSEFLYINNP